ncbi:MFS multidrug transporter [Tothia fuscella]|uniref:MFS multidrug transporter n=1 Tax=Tothia fuscella TaxID=1048955 RepID=A0A9P4NGU4_9PEZI|nr:MFS multidrug transporter [Tothia fuscella]
MEAQNIGAKPAATTEAEKLSIVSSNSDEATLSKGNALEHVETEEAVYPTGPKVAVIMGSLYISMFLVALDRTIIATAIPRITDEFHSIDDIGWYGSAYMLTACGFILIYGRVYTFYSTKWTFLSGIFLFEVGSAICGAAPSSTVLIVGRAIAGFGSSGIFTGAINIMINTVPLHKRPLYQGLFGACFAVASVAGPLMGGAFTDSKATWRWCFYINLPLGAVTIIALIFLLQLNEKEKVEMTFTEKLRHLDPIGTLFFLPSIICLLLALQWGGTHYAWGSWRIVVLLVVFAVLMVGFIVIQVLHKDTTATIPARIITQRSVMFGSIYTFFSGSAFMVSVFYLPLWFQAIKGASAVRSGIMSIPLILSLVVAAMLAGAMVQRFGYYTPFMYAGATIMSIGAGLVTTFKTDTGHQKWIGYQILLGLGIGMGMQQSNLAVQTVLHHRDIPTGSAIMFFWQSLGGTIFVSVGQNLFLDKFISQLSLLPKGIIDPRQLMSIGATDIRNVVPKDNLDEVISAYNYALVKGPLLAGVICASLAIIGALGMEFRSTKEKLQQKRASKDLEKDSELKMKKGTAVEEKSL